MPTDVMWEIRQGSCVSVMREMESDSIDSIVTDPPYDLKSIVKRFGKKGSAPAKEGTDGRYQRLSRGFMGKTWDGTGVAFRVETWQEAYRILKPGSHLLAFGGTRTYHRMTCAIEDAGFEIRDCLMWIYGTGFPKSLNLDGGLGTALKPAFEPIVLARKPLVGSVKANVEQHGTGALNIDECRIGETPIITSGRRDDRHADSHSLGTNWSGEISTDPHFGRWPANVLFDEEAAAELDQQSGETTSKRMSGVRTGHSSDSGWGMAEQDKVVMGHDDIGGASRFFFVAKPDRAERDTGLEGLSYHSTGEITGRVDGSLGTQSPRAGSGRTSGGRNIHPTVKPVALMVHLVSLVTPPGGLVLDPFVGSGTTVMAALRVGRRAIGIEESPEYVEIAKRRIVGDSPLLNNVDLEQAVASKDRQPTLFDLAGV